jgi:Zn-dependent peptidase ImmA (M78 family)
MSSSERDVFYAARAIRHDAGLTPDKPADPLAIAESLGIDVVIAPLGADEAVEGAFLRRNGRSFVFLNGSKKGRRLKFTCAHELGHFALTAEDDVEVLDTTVELDSASDVREREASLFADELLMPLAGLQAVLTAGMTVENAVGLVSRTYNVSPASATIRMKIAGFIDADRATAVRRVIDEDWRRFWREQDIPPDTAGLDSVRLPARFLAGADRLLENGVISDERYAELVGRNLPSSS